MMKYGTSPATTAGWVVTSINGIPMALVRNAKETLRRLDEADPSRGRINGNPKEANG